MSDEVAGAMSGPGLIDALRSHAEQRPDSAAVRTGDTAVSYRSLLDGASRLAAEITRNGVATGESVAILVSAPAEFAAAYYGTLLAGAVAVPLHPTHEPERLAGRLRHSGARLALCAVHPPRATRSALAMAAIRTVVDVGASVFDADADADAGTDDGAASTSGAPRAPSIPAQATVMIDYGLSDDPDRPAAVELTQTNLAYAARTMATSVLGLSEDDALLSCLPQHTVLGLTCGLHAAISSGACLTVSPRFDPAEILRTVHTRRVTVLATLPALLPQILRAGQRSPAGLGSLRAIVRSSGSTLPSLLRESLTDTASCALVDCYGPPEASALACATPLGSPPRPGSVGPAVDGTRIRILGTGGRDAPIGSLGELLISGPQVMAGYRDDPGATGRAVRDGWLHTGDGARMDQDGWVYPMAGGWFSRVSGPRPARRGRFGGGIAGLFARK